MTFWKTKVVLSLKKINEAFPMFSTDTRSVAVVAWKKRLAKKKSILRALEQRVERVKVSMAHDQALLLRTRKEGDK